MSTLCYGTRTKRVAQGTAASKTDLKLELEGNKSINALDQFQNSWQPGNQVNTTRPPYQTSKNEELNEDKAETHLA